MISRIKALIKKLKPRTPNVTLGEVHRSLEMTLVKNIANDILQITFHQQMTDEALEAYYGGGASRAALIEDTVARLNADRKMLEFFYQNKNEFLNEHSTHDGLTGAYITAQRAANASAQDQSKPTGNDENGSGEGTVPEVQPGDNAGGDVHAGDVDDESPQDAGDGGSVPGSAPRNA